MGISSGNDKVDAIFRDAIRGAFPISELLEVAKGGLHATLIRTYKGTGKDEVDVVESKEYADWSERRAWWVVIAQTACYIDAPLESTIPTEKQLTPEELAKKRAELEQELFPGR